ncbi:MAG: hypothetical protein IKU43_02930 [Clostridia bacterium]|nr:hypothetical protein [Clostridia bacterium]
MPEKNNRTAVFALLFTAVSIFEILLPITGATGTALAASPIFGIVCSFLIMLLYYCFLMSLGEKSNKLASGLGILALPIAALCVVGVMTDSSELLLYRCLGFIAYAATSAVIYRKALGKQSRADASAVAAFVMLLFAGLEIAIPLFISAAERGVSVSTVIFDGIDSFISEFVSLYTATLSEVAAMNPAINPAMLTVNEKMLTDSLITYIALMPSILYAVYFFAMLIFGYIADFLCKRMAVYGEYAFGRFNVSPTAHIIFNIFGTLTVISLLFESSLSPFTFGVMNVLIALLPNYIVLGIRKIHRILSKKTAPIASVIIITAVTVFGLSLSPFLLILAVIFFGTSEYRQSRADISAR